MPKPGEPWSYVKWDCENPKFRYLYGNRCSTARWKTRLGEDEEKKGGGEKCRKNKECASGTCKGNWGGVRNGKCTAPPRKGSIYGKKRHGEECRKNAECVSRECDGNMHGLKAGTCKGNKLRDPNSMMAKINRGASKVKSKVEAKTKLAKLMIFKGVLKLAKTAINKHFRGAMSPETMKDINDVIADVMRHVDTGKAQLTPERWVNIAKGVVPQLVILLLRKIAVLSIEPAELYQVPMHRPHLAHVMILCVVTVLV